MKLVLDSGVEIHIEKIKVMELNPTDIIILEYNGYLTTTAHENIIKSLTAHFPLNKVLFLEEDLKIRKIERL